MAHSSPSPPELPPAGADKRKSWLWLGALAATLWLVWLLSPMLTPFLLGAILAYIFDPTVQWLERHRLPRALSVMLVIVLLGVAIALLVLTLVPLINKEVRLIAERLPDYLRMANEQAVPWLNRQLGLDLSLDLSGLGTLVTDNMEGAKDLAGKVLASLRVGGLAVLGVLINLVLIPVVMFFLMRDWDTLIAHVDVLIPRPWHDRIRRLMGEVDHVMAEFLRGQLSVMALLAIYYSLALWLAGLEFFLPVGLLTGLLIFIPYVGFGTGFVLALLTAALQLQGWGIVVAVLVVYGVGNLLESFLLTPLLVGERIGLHPLAVIFSLLAFAQLFGFVGILMALPASAALLVGLREVRAGYLQSQVYLGR